jgi:glycosyltransferase involved in cell wall biosynthesis
VLIVNDGSKDKTEEIALQYQERYPDTFKVLTKENGGHGSTINKGIEQATGKYFKVVDGDDWLDKGAFLDLVKILKDCDADIVATNYLKFYIDSKKTSEFNYKNVEYGKVLNFDQIMLTEYVTMPSMNIKTEILKHNKITIDEKMFYVDLEYTIYPIPFVSTILFIDRAVYIYRIGTISQSMNSKNLIRNKKQHLFVLFRLIDFYSNLNITEGKDLYIKTRILRIIRSHYLIYMNYPIANLKSKRELQTFDRQLKEYNPCFYNLSNDDKSVRRLRTANLLSYKYFSMLYKIKGVLSSWLGEK